MAFAVWFVVSALVVRLEKVGFDLSTTQLFWLAAMPGLAGGTFRIVHTFLMPIYGTRRVVSALDRDAPHPARRLVLRRPGPGHAVLGAPRASRSSPVSAAATSRRSCPRRACSSRSGSRARRSGIQAGIGNFGVSLVQFLTPWVIGFALVGSAQATDKGEDVWLQNAALIWIPFVAFLALVAWLRLRSVPVRANVREQFDIFRDKHTWLMTSLYVMTFGSFAGLRRDVPADDQGGLRRLRGRARPAHVRVPGAARRLDRARRRPARSPTASAAGG